jgi:hypothetical protein
METAGQKDSSHDEELELEGGGEVPLSVGWRRTNGQDFRRVGLHYT